jgi:hypothetical protein
VSPDFRPAPGSSMQYMVATAFSHQSIAQFLSGLPNIQQGAVALLTTRAGVPLATSQALPLLNETNIFQSNNTFFKAAAINLDGLVYNVDSSLDITATQISRSVDILGTRYDMQATVLDTGVEGIQWVLAMFTPTSVYEGDLPESNRNTLILSAVVLAVSVLITFILTHWINRPLMKIIAFMERLAHDTTDDSFQQNHTEPLINNTHTRSDDSDDDDTSSSADAGTGT